MEQKKSLKQLQAEEARKKDKVKKLNSELNVVKKELGALAKAIAAAKKAEANKKKAAKKPAKKK